MEYYALSNSTCASVLSNRYLISLIMRMFAEGSKNEQEISVIGEDGKVWYTYNKCPIFQIHMHKKYCFVNITNLNDRIDTILIMLLSYFKPFGLLIFRVRPLFQRICLLCFAYCKNEVISRREKCKKV